MDKELVSLFEKIGFSESKATETAANKKLSANLNAANAELQALLDRQRNLSRASSKTGQVAADQEVVGAQTPLAAAPELDVSGAASPVSHGEDSGDAIVDVPVQFVESQCPRNSRK